MMGDMTTSQGEILPTGIQDQLRGCCENEGCCSVTPVDEEVQGMYGGATVKGASEGAERLSQFIREFVGGSINMAELSLDTQEALQRTGIEAG